MASQVRVMCLAVALLTGLAAYWWLSGGADETVHGMSETPCTKDGKPISGGPRDDWGQLCKFRAENTELLEKEAYPEVVMIGDSITARWPKHGNGFANRGIGGQMSGQVLLRFQQDAIALKPKVIHLLVGINDITGVYGPESPDMLQHNIRAMVELAQANTIPVIIGTIGPAQDVNWRPQVDRHRWIPFINNWLAQYVKQERLVLADYHAVLSQEDGSLRKDLFSDTIHPNKQGYAAMEAILLEAIQRTTGDRRAPY